MKSVACSHHLPLSGHMDRIKALPPSSMKRFLPPSRHMERITQRITHRSMETLAAVDDNNHVSPPTPAAGHDKWPPVGSVEEYIEYLEKRYPPHLPPYPESEDLDKRYPPHWPPYPESPYPESEYPVKFHSTGFHLRDFESLCRWARQVGADRFRMCYTYGSVKEGCNNSKEQKTCIWPGDTLSWQEVDESSGIMWVAVHGKDSICVVTKNEDMDATRLSPILEQLMSIHEVPFRFRKSVIVEIEDLADPTTTTELLVPAEILERFSKWIEKEKPRERFDKKIEKPFGVVSVIPDAYKSREGSGHEASSVEYDETKAIEFLQDKVKSDAAFTVTETIQTAIAAFEQLFQKKFNADEIKVSVLDPNYVDYCKGDSSGHDLTYRQINEHLAVINNPGPKDSSSDSEDQ